MHVTYVVITILAALANGYAAFLNFVGRRVSEGCRGQGAGVAKMDDSVRHPAGLVAVLDPDVELRIDGGVLRAEASLILRGAEAVAGYTATYSKLHPFIRPALVNGAAGAVVAPHGQLFSVMAFTVTDGKITQIDALVDPDRLAQLDLPFPDASP